MNDLGISKSKSKNKNDNSLTNINPTSCSIKNAISINLLNQFQKLTTVKTNFNPNFVYALFGNIFIKWD